MQQICKDYYEVLYTAREGTPASEGAKFQALRCVQDKLTPRMKQRLRELIQLGELQRTVNEMCTGKSLGPDGMVLEFYKEYWSLIRNEFLEMIHESVHRGRMPTRVTLGMIALLHKGGPRVALTNWRPIILLNLSYKIYAKAIQLRLQPVLMEIISCE
jgi:hypothetical protein